MVILKGSKHTVDASHDRLFDTAGCATVILDHISVGVLLVDTAFHLLFGNRCGLQVLDRGGWLRLRDGRVHGESGTQSHRLYEVFGALMEGGDAKSASSLILDHADTGAPLFVTIRPFDYAVGPAQTRTRKMRRGLLFVTDPEGMHDPSETALCEIWGLTRREAEVVRHLTFGRRVETIAAEMGISVSTARSYTKSIFSKAGVTSQIDLIRLALKGTGCHGSS